MINLGARRTWIGVQIYLKKESRFLADECMMKVPDSTPKHEQQYNNYNLYKKATESW